MTCIEDVSTITWTTVIRSHEASLLGSTITGVAVSSIFSYVAIHGHFLGVRNCASLAKNGITSSRFVHGWAEVVSVGIR